MQRDLRDFVERLKFYRELEQFDGPLLTEWRDETTNDHESVPYVEKWCDVADGVHKWMLVKVTPLLIETYLEGHITMHDLLSSDDGRCLIVSRCKDVNAEVEEATVASLPHGYMPTASAYHDPSLRPGYDDTDEEGDPDESIQGKSLPPEKTCKRLFRFVTRTADLHDAWDEAELVVALGEAGVGLLTFYHDDYTVAFGVPRGPRHIYVPGKREAQCLDNAWIWGRATEVYQHCLEYFGLGPFLLVCWPP